MSLTIKGLLILVFGLLFKSSDIELPIENLQIFVEVLLILGGIIVAWIGRIRKGDVNILGMRTK